MAPAGKVRPAPTPSALDLALYGGAIALSAFLLFLVQPIIARQLLRWFGGSAAVWTTCLVFFQGLLLAGYAWADWLQARPARTQALLHGALLLASLAWLPLAANPAWRPHSGTEPIGRILLLLTTAIGLPYLLLSTTGPLLQATFARGFPQARVYRLYALSNAGSVLALLAYPLLLEPELQGRTQASLWSLGYAAWAVLLGVLLVRAARRDTPRVEAPVPVAPRPRWPAMAGWLLLSAAGSMLLMTVTNHLTQNIAPIPLLWILPLAIYLVTFMLCFDGDGWYRPRFYGAASLVAAVLLLASLTFRPGGRYGLEPGQISAVHAVPLYAIGLFVLCMFCHGELALRRPDATVLTRFYLMVAAGGVLGGLLVGVVAPLLLSDYLELPVLLTALLFAVGLLHTGRLRAAALTAWAVGFVLLIVHLAVLRADVVDQRRNFYGVLRVRPSPPVAGEAPTLQLWHGGILHGEQFTARDTRDQPTSYYGPTSGIGRLLRARGAPSAALAGRPLKVGVVGLGVGTLATWARAGDDWQFYELNPQVVAVAERYFSFLRDTPARVRTVIGDARLSLEHQPPQGFDLLVIDAFSGDAIPVHLLTREALQVYRRHLQPDGVLALHVSNRELALAPIVARLAEEASLSAIRVLDTPAAGARHVCTSDWVLLVATTRAQAVLRDLGAGEILISDKQLRPWTDDFSNLLAALKVWQVAQPPTVRNQALPAI